MFQNVLAIKHSPQLFPFAVLTTTYQNVWPIDRNAQLDRHLWEKMVIKDDWFELWKKLILRDSKRQRWSTIAFNIVTYHTLDKNLTVNRNEKLSLWKSPTIIGGRLLQHRLASRCRKCRAEETELGVKSFGTKIQQFNFPSPYNGTSRSVHSDYPWARMKMGNDHLLLVSSFRPMMDLICKGRKWFSIFYFQQHIISFSLWWWNKVNSLNYFNDVSSSFKL